MTNHYTPTTLDHSATATKLYSVINQLLTLPERIADERVFQLAGKDDLLRLQQMQLSPDGRKFDEVVDEMLNDVYAHRARMNHPRCFAFIPTPASPLSWIGEMLTAAHNPFAGSWLQSSGPSVIERKLVDFLCARLGFPPSAGGLFVSGGSMANLTALTVARDQKLAPENRTSALVYVSTQTHSSVAKGLKIIGFLDHQIRRIEVDKAFRLSEKHLLEVIEQDRAAGLTPFAVVASAGTTNTGSIDPLTAIADTCQSYNLWMHVDGAFGASIAMSTTHAWQLSGIERADSVSWDAHKWLFQTYGCGAILLRNRQHLLQSFHTRPEYLQDAQTDDETFNFWDFGPELTRPARALKLWLTLQVLGLRAIGDAIDHGVQLAQWAEDEVRKLEDWQIVSPAQLAIVNFRFAPSGCTPEAIDALNVGIARRAMAEGFAGVLTTRLNGLTVLRICALHPDATEWDMRETVRRLSGYAQREQQNAQ
jgi:glutamate/tyrosine decarboxylase-like PLP-dependent enzyme